ncbi:MAG: T9SS C-terminal target domain-containing protein [Ignavibacteriae bacterium]|nr:MAG: T9SS C-terminal target domain-containing protein [Ignavibacteriota bacterium]
MTKLLRLILVLLMSVTSWISLYAQEIPPDSLYLGQTPPGNIPFIFDLPVTSGFRPCERIAITSDGKEIYYGEINTYPPSALRVKCFKYQNNEWQGPYNVFEGFIAPKFSPDDSVLYLQDNTFHTFYSKRTSTGWSVPVRLISQNLRTHYYQITDLNNFYASSYYEGSSSNGDISQLITVNQDTILQSLGIPLNSSLQENDFLIAADESYLLFSRNIPNAASDMHLSFKRNDGRWTNPKKLGEPINKPGYVWEYGQFISNDGKYLFYTSGGLAWTSYFTYWIKIDNIIDSLRSTNFTPYLNYQIPNQSIDTSQSFNYTIPDSTFIDDDGNNTLTYSATLNNGNPLPAWLSFDPLAGTFSGTPTEVSNINVKVTATDSANVSVSCTFAFNVIITGVIENKELLPESINLYQNYPNPFNPTTTIEFVIPGSEYVSLRIYDTLGREVKDLFSGNLKAGNHKFEFDAKNISSGIYFYVLKTSTFCEQKKMIAVK